MAQRVVFLSKEQAPYYETMLVDFAWNKGLSVSQKQKNVSALHEIFRKGHPQKNVLEISSKSMQENGKELSAFFLTKYVSDLQAEVSVEQIYQASKVFENGGPYTDLMMASPKDAKRDERLRTSGRVIAYQMGAQKYPCIPVNAFYDYVYINALLEHPKLAETVLQYDAFTDIEFNPNKGLNCQARAAAVFVSLSKLGKIDKVRNFDCFLKTTNPDFMNGFRKEEDCIYTEPKKEEIVSAPVFTTGQKLMHPQYGMGIILSVDQNILMVEFPKAGKKRLGLIWCNEHCSVKTIIADS